MPGRAAGTIDLAVERPAGAPSVRPARSYSGGTCRIAWSVASAIAGNDPTIVDEHHRALAHAEPHDRERHPRDERRDLQRDDQRADRPA